MRCSVCPEINRSNILASKTKQEDIDIDMSCNDKFSALDNIKLDVEFMYEPASNLKLLIDEDRIILRSDGSIKLFKLSSSLESVVEYK